MHGFLLFDLGGGSGVDFRTRHIGTSDDASVIKSIRFNRGLFHKKGAPELQNNDLIDLFAIAWVGLFFL